MSITLPKVDLSAVGSTFQIAPPSDLQANQIGYLRFLNESPYNLQMNAGGMQIPIPAWADYPILISRNNQVQAGFSLPIVMQSDLLSTTPGTYSTKLIVTFYSPGEVPSSTVPVSLVRQTFIPNAITTVGGIASSIQNDGNAAGTSLVESTVSGDVASAVSLTNDAILILGSTAHNGSLTTFGPATIANRVKILSAGSEIRFQELNGADFRYESPAGNQVGRIANNGRITAGDSTGNGQILGGDIFSSTGRFQFGSPGSSVLILFSSGPDTVIVINGGGGHFYWNNNAGTRIASIDSNGNMILKGTLTQNGMP